MKRNFVISALCVILALFFLSACGNKENIEYSTASVKTQDVIIKTEPDKEKTAEETKTDKEEILPSEEKEELPEKEEEAENTETLSPEASEDIGVTEDKTEEISHLTEPEKELKATEKPKTEIKKEEKKQETNVKTEEKPKEPVKELPETADEETKNEFVCSLVVRCSSVLENIDKLSEGKRAIIPADGVFYSSDKAEFSEGESVFDVLQRELKNNKIHLEYVKNTMYNSVYIEGIGNLYEFDMGDLSGWLYKVNGVKPTYGSSQYKVKKGDKIEFIYSCNYLKE